jgi:hypothetical protein
MESRMARLEGAYEQVSQRLMNIDPRFDGVDRKIDLRFDALDKKVDASRDALDKKIDAVGDTLDKKIDTVDKKIDAVRDALNKKIDGLDAKFDQRFMWTVGIILTTWLTSIGTTIASIYLRH